MSPMSGLSLVGLVLALVAIGPARARAEGLDNWHCTLVYFGGKGSHAAGHAGEVMPIRPDVVAVEGKKTGPLPHVDRVFVVERAEGDRVLIRPAGGGRPHVWVAAKDVIAFVQAEAFFTARIRADGRRAFPYLMRAVSRQHLEQYGLALADLDEAVRLEPQSVPALAWRSGVHAELDRRDDAFADIYQAIALAPSDPELYIDRAYLHLKFDRSGYKEAMADFAHAIQLAPSDASFLIGRAMVNSKANKTRESVNDARHALAIAADEKDVFLAAVLLLIEAGEHREARDILTARLAKRPDHDLEYKCRVLISMIDLERLRIRSGLSELEEAIAFDPAREDAYLMLSSVEYRLGRSRQARLNLDTAIGVNPSSVDLYEARSALEYGLREYDQALADMRAAARVAPERPETHERIALFRATCPDAKFRDGKEAQAEAVRACELSKWKTAHYLATLAAADAEAGDFTAAIAHQEKAIALLDKDSYEKYEYRDNLERYRKGKPCYRLGLLEEWGFRPARRRAD